jgi:hypothetical protein
MSRSVEPARAWGVGVVGGRAWPVSRDDIDAETTTAAALLALLGLPAGGLVLIVSRLSATIHVAPLELAAGRLSARWSSADATPGDAFRAVSLTRQLAPDVVIGVSGTLIDAIGDAAEVLSLVPCVAVVDERARAAIPRARRWLQLGPTNAFECGERAGAHFDATQWRVEQGSPHLTITNIAPRLTPAEALDTGIDGDVVTAPCACGSAWPRVVIA